MTEQPDMRASDQDRERVAEMLRVAVSDGRITLDEFNERVDRTFTARTRGQLDVLVADLWQTRAVAPAVPTAAMAVPGATGALELHTRSGKVVHGRALDGAAVHQRQGGPVRHGDDRLHPVGLPASGGRDRRGDHLLVR